MSIFNHFKHLNLSQGQGNALIKLEAFLDSPVPVFMLKGYAGSGKTTVALYRAKHLLDTQSNLFQEGYRENKVKTY